MRILIVILLLTFGYLYSDIIWQDDFESASEWILDGEFEIDSPQGLGGEYGNPDPASAYNGSNVLGVDLTGLGSYPGDYETNLGDHEYSAVSPVIDCSSFINVQLNFAKWLNVEQPAYDHAYISVSNDNGISWIDIWTNSSALTDNSWNLDNYDISDLADMNQQIKIRFSIGSTDSSWQYSGWNIDDISIEGDPVVYGSIEGNVVDSITSDPIPFAQISCPFAYSISDENGYFLINNIPTGEREIFINAIGYFNFESDLITVTENDTAYIFCEMTENPDTPAAPVNLQAEVIENTQVNLWWEAPRDLLLAYNIYRNGFLIESTNELEFLDEIFVAGTYEYFVTAIYDVGESLPSNTAEVLIEEVGVFNIELPMTNLQMTNYPNPFNPTTTISFNVTQTSSFVTLEIFNIKGQKVKTLLNSLLSAGHFECIWNGKDNSNKSVSSGEYFARLKVNGEEIDVRKMLLLR
ncbi:MAG: hypothetical protein K9N09_12295 [Candidatus Cloacimonetes bacterium]|nr:hypothetical protein [Candidatus Cloacimonadota bacterium]MCF7815374.1 hypothetical protein [Candidatus Cloacimonadota bacterium]MCF7869464.1 hypothetical protein [Candidatus Cloacimonadota bacterium]MCF7884831.1 hypothetical protein [Candidatus Cloacimonadota bacterium]